jgi:hypothetical protein
MVQRTMKSASAQNTTRRCHTVIITHFPNGQEELGLSLPRLWFQQEKFLAYLSERARRLIGTALFAY